MDKDKYRINKHTNKTMVGFNTVGQCCRNAREGTAILDYTITVVL